MQRALDLSHLRHGLNGARIMYSLLMAVMPLTNDMPSDFASIDKERFALKTSS